MLYCISQGQVHFDANGIRDVVELRVLQYRTDYVNKTPILGDGRMQSVLMLIDVAYLGKNDNDSLVFFDGDKHGIWPSMYNACILKCTCIKIHVECFGRLCSI